MMWFFRSPLQRSSVAPSSFPRKRESSLTYFRNSRVLSFSNTFIGNRNETLTGPPIKTFGGDDNRINSHQSLLMPRRLLPGSLFLQISSRAQKEILALFFTLSFLCVSPLFAHDDRPIALRAVDLEQKLGVQLPLDVTLRDETGRTVALKQYFGRRPLILTFVYYGCEELCPLVLDGLVRSLRPLSFNIGDEFDVLTVSFDARDTPALAAAKKRDFVKQYSRSGAEEGWHFLTGDEAAIERLTEAAGFRFNYEIEKNRFGHATGIILLTPGGTIARYFFGMEFSPRDLRLGLIEASGDKIASPIDQLLLFCYRYDPASGKYGLLITNIIRLAGIATVIALVTFIAVMLRRDRNQKWQAENLSGPTVHGREERS